MACALVLFAMALQHTCLASPDPQPSQSAQSLKKLTLAQLGNVEVTTYSKTPSELWRYAGRGIRDHQRGDSALGATNIADALRLAPGVEVGRYSSD